MSDQLSTPVAPRLSGEWKLEESHQSEQFTATFGTDGQLTVVERRRDGTLGAVHRLAFTALDDGTIQLTGPKGQIINGSFSDTNTIVFTDHADPDRGMLLTRLKK